MIDIINISQSTKNLLKSYAASDYIHSRLQLSFAEVLVPVIDFITNNSNKEELLKILDEEIQASKDKCFQGRLCIAFIRTDKLFNRFVCCGFDVVIVNRLRIIINILSCFRSI